MSKPRKPQSQPEPGEFEPGAKLVAYLRASEGDAQDLSVERQEAIVRNWALENGYTITRIFADDDRSGRYLDGRDNFLAMVDYLGRDAPEAGVVLWEYSRFFRNFNKAQYFLSLIREQGYQIVSITQPLPGGAFGKALESFHIAAAEEESARLSIRIQGGIDHVAVTYHCYPSCIPPMGYKFEYFSLGTRRSGQPHRGKRLTPDPETAPVVQKIFKMKLEGYSLREIWLACDRPMKIPQNLTALLRNPIYKGLYVAKRVTVPGFCEPLIDEATWDGVQVIMDRWLSTYGPRRTYSTFLLSGLVRCGLCGAPMIGKRCSRPNSDGSRYSRLYYYCDTNYSCAQQRCKNRMIPADEIEPRVIDRVMDLIDKPDILRLLQVEREKSVLHADEGRKQDLVAARRKLAGILRQQDSIMRMVRAGTEDGQRTPAAIMRELSELEAQEREARESVVRLESLAPAPAVIPDLEQLSKDIRAAVSDRRLLQLLLRSIILEVRPTRRGETIGGEIDYVLGVQGTIAL